MNTNRYMGITNGSNLNMMAVPSARPVMVIGGMNMQPQHVQLLKSSYMSKEEKVEMGAKVVKTGLSTIFAYKAGRSMG